MLCSRALFGIQISRLRFWDHPQEIQFAECVFLKIQKKTKEESVTVKNKTETMGVWNQCIHDNFCQWMWQKNVEMAFTKKSDETK